MVASAHEKDREWAKGARNSDYQSKLAFLTVQPENMDRLSCDPRILSRQKTFENVYRREPTMAGKKEVDILHTEFYLTRAEENHQDQINQVQQQLLPYVHFGRPNYAEIFLTLRVYAIKHREAKVAVMVCGPKPMVNEVRSLCSSMSSDGVAFHFHGEIFEF